MAHAEHPTIRDYSKKSHMMGHREYRVSPTPLLWHGENNNLIYQAFMVLQSALVAVLLVAGMDKFVGILANWTDYLMPIIPQILGTTAKSFLYVVGICEIVIAVGIALWPRVFSWVVMAWLGAIIFNLLLLGQHYDIVLRDFGLAVAAFALSRLSNLKEEVPVVVSETNEFSAPELAH